MDSLNLSDWALRHRPFNAFLMVLLVAGGALAYFRLGQQEDPSFTFRVMAIKAYYPGATAEEVQAQLTDRLERKLQELPELDFIESYSRPGEANLFVHLRQNSAAARVPELWYQVRKKVSDVRNTLPPGVLGPFFNDEFGDTYSLVYFLATDGATFAQLKDLADDVRQQLLRVPFVEKIDFFGEQDEKIYVEFDDAKLARFGVDATAVAASLQGQNSIGASGVLTTDTRDLYLRPSGRLIDLGSIASLPIRVGAVTFAVADVATVRRGTLEPAAFAMRVNGRPGLGIGVTIDKHANILEVGGDIEKVMAPLRASLPGGVSLVQVADQPRVVHSAIAEFKRTFFEALTVVLIVSFLSLGLRAGSVVAITVPLVLAATFLVMWVAGIDLHRISLGALVLALGLLVDDAMIVVEMMSRKLEAGVDRIRAATFAYRSTALPMLTGTLVTVAGFLPVGLAQSNAGEYTRAIFQVTGISLILSWICAVLFTPHIGYALLRSRAHAGEAHAPYESGFYRRLRSLVELCVRHRWWTSGGTLVVCLLGVLAFVYVPKQFFPESNRPELLVDLWLPEGSSFAATDEMARRLEASLRSDPDIDHFTAYIGGGTPRFFLLINQQLNNENLTEFVVVARDNQARERVRSRLQPLLERTFAGVHARVQRMAVGPPIDYPIAYRVTGPDPGVVRVIATRVAKILAANPKTHDVVDDWRERVLSAALDVDQDRARALGVTSAVISQALQAHFTGITVGQYREGNKLIDIVWRAQDGEREIASGLADAMIRSSRGASIPLGQVARVTPRFEPNILWRRNRAPTITVEADLREGAQAVDVAAELDKALAPVRARLPLGYFIDEGGAVEQSKIAQRSIFRWLPVAIVASLFLLMVQLQSVSRALLVSVTGPLALVGAAMFLFLFGRPYGFVALLGILATGGMIMRNTVILVDQIRQEELSGHDTWTAIIESTVRRFRPIMLTAAAAVLAMIPLSRSDFFGAQALAIMGGLVVGTVLTVLFVPALYAIWFRVRNPVEKGGGSTLAALNSAAPAAEVSP
ncbi:MAG: multidrug transporter AcrB [Gammaproteobacteria bacterium]|nr:multidrug transporter AcrB [Gammaproteobacteria bacterium]